MKRILFVFISLLLLFSSATYAACSSISCSGIGLEVVKRVYLSSAGNIHIEGPADVTNLNCTLVSGKYMTLKGGPDGHVLYKEIYSTILTGISTNKYLSFRVREGTSNCEIIYATMLK